MKTEIQEWLPIDQAPKDGTRVFTCHTDYENSGGESFWDRYIKAWRDKCTGEVVLASHYMIIPPPPRK